MIYAKYYIKEKLNQIISVNIVEMTYWLQASSVLLLSYCTQPHVHIIYPSGADVGPFSPIGPCGSERSSSSSSDEPALEDSSSLSANTLRMGLELGGSHTDKLAVKRLLEALA